MVAGGIDEHLRLVLQSAKGFAVEDAITVPLVAGPDRIRILGLHPSGVFNGSRGVRGKGCDLSLLDRLANVVRHADIVPKPLQLFREPWDSLLEHPLLQP